MKILFWNTNRKKYINEYIVSLVKDNNIDVLVLAEYVDDQDELYVKFKRADIGLERCNTYGCERIEIWSKYINITPGFQDDYYSIQIIMDKFILCGVHLMSDLYGDRSQERYVKAQEIIRELEKTGKEIKSSCSIIIGDMNEMPYNNGCLNANGFHGLPVLDYSDKETRIVCGTEYRKFYNPMWNLMGDFVYPPGTYYLNEAKIASPVWYMLDQIIISMGMIPLFQKKSLKILTTCSAGELKDKNGHPNKKDVSDHFPIMCEFID